MEMKTIKELEAEILSTTWADERFIKKGAVDALKDVLGLIDKGQEELRINSFAWVKLEELKARINGS